MITHYHRPESMGAALALFARPDVITLPIAGDSGFLTGQEGNIEVVDLQALGLDTIEEKGNKIVIGAAVRLQELLDENPIPGLVMAIRHEAGYNQRHTASVVGSLLRADGRSPFATAMLAADAEVIKAPGDEKIRLGDFLPLKTSGKTGDFITHIQIPANIELCYKYSSRTPADVPIVAVAAARWRSGRTRVAVGGFGDYPMLAMDGPSPDGAETAVLNAYQEAGDQWASGAYRSEVAAVLVRRCFSV